MRLEGRLGGQLEHPMVEQSDMRGTPCSREWPLIGRKTHWHATLVRQGPPCLFAA